MKAANLNHFHANLMVEELVRCGIELFCISPGSRNTPLVIAAAENPKARTITHFDERGAAFFAVGYAKGSGKPAVVMCTSGTAVANYFPAVVEAYQSGTPLLLLTADRPVEALNSDSYQTIDQRYIFGSYVKQFDDLQLGDPAISPELLLSTVDHSWVAATAVDPGPAQINCRFREPLAPLGKLVDFGEELAELREWRQSELPLTQFHSQQARSQTTGIETVAEKITESTRGVLVAGVLRSAEIGAQIIALAKQWQWPLISDICSHTRFASPQSTEAITFADNYLRVEEIAKDLEPDVIVQFGRTPISKFVAGYAARATERYVVVAPGIRRIDPYNRISDRLAVNYESALTDLRSIDPNPSALLAPFLELEGLARSASEQWFEESEDALLGSRVAAEICSSGDAPRSLFLATSMAIRETNSFAASRNLKISVAANRGVNGIDGTIASAVGYALATRQHTTLLIGDLAVLHDLNSLALVRASEVPVTIVILNNDGGEIFSYLPLARVDAHFEEFFRTPHSLDFSHAADMFGLKYYQPLNFRDFSTIYRHSLNGNRSVIIEAKIDRDRNVIQHKEYWESLQEDARGVIRREG